MNKVFYMCGVDWQHELGDAHPFTKVFPTVEALKSEFTCWEQCGIVRVTIDTSNVEWILKQDFNIGREE